MVKAISFIFLFAVFSLIVYYTHRFSRSMIHINRKKPLRRSLSYISIALMILFSFPPVYASEIPTPSTPTNFSVTVLGPHSVGVQWDMYGLCDGFAVFYKNNHSSEIRFDAFSGTTTQAGVTTHHYESIDELEPGTSYSFYVFAFNDDPSAPEEPAMTVNIRKSDSTSEVTVTTDPITISAPGTLSAGVISMDTVQLLWQDNSNNETGFKVERKQGTGAWQEVAQRPQDWPKWTDTGLSAGVIYTYRIYAYNQYGQSGYSNEISITITPGTAPVAPGNLTVGILSAEAAEIEWQDNSYNEEGFKVERKQGSGIWQEVAVRPKDWPRWIDIGLMPGATYTYRIYAYNSVGDSDHSNEFSITMAEETEVPDTSGASVWARAEIEEAWYLGLTTDKVMSGFQEPITREEFCEIAVLLYEKLSGVAAVPVDPDPFTDTDNIEILKAFELGITKGISATLFAPGNLITRQQICCMLVRAVKAVDPDLEIEVIGAGPFADEDLIAAWAITEVRFCNRYEVMKGIGNNYIDPMGNTTREQAICLIRRMFEAAIEGF